MKLNIEISDEQLQLIINALEINFRLMMSEQQSIVADLLMPIPDLSDLEGEKRKIEFERYLVKRKDVSFVLRALSRITFPAELDLPKDCHRLSDMWTAFRHVQWQLLNNPDDWADVRSDKPFPTSDYPMMKVEVLK